MLFYSTIAAVESSCPMPRTRSCEQHTMCQQIDAFRQEGGYV